MVGVLALAVLTGKYWQRLLLPPRDPLYNLRCPGCKRRLHYRASRAGKKAQCPKCKHIFVYPVTPPPQEQDTAE